MTAAKAKLLFTFAAFGEAPIRSVRQLAEVSGTSKSNIAKLRNELVDEGTLTSNFHLRNDNDLASQLLRAYEALPSKLLINRFKAPDQSTGADRNRSQ
jgi:hypothetical protein